MAESDEYDIRQIAQRRQLRRAYQGRASVDQLLELSNSDQKRPGKKHNSAEDYQGSRGTLSRFQNGTGENDFDNFDPFPKKNFSRGSIFTDTIPSAKPGRFVDNLPGFISDQNVPSLNNVMNNMRSGTSSSIRSFPEANRANIMDFIGNSNESTKNGFIFDAKRTSLSTSLISSLPFEDGGRIGRMQVPPYISCECNGVEANAMMDTSISISLMSAMFVDKLKLNDDVIREISSMNNCFVPENVEIIGRLKYIELYIGDSLFISQFYVVEKTVADVVLGTDFLKKSQAIIDVGNGCVTFVDKLKKQKVTFLSNKQALMISKSNKVSQRTEF